MPLLDNNRIQGSLDNSGYPNFLFFFLPLFLKSLQKSKFQRHLLAGDNKMSKLYLLDFLILLL